MMRVSELSRFSNSAMRSSEFQMPCSTAAGGCWEQFAGEIDEIVSFFPPARLRSHPPASTGHRLRLQELGTER